MSQTMPCLFVDLPVVRANTRAMVELCHASGIRPVGITKLACGAHPVAEALIDGGIDIIGLGTDFDGFSGETDVPDTAHMQHLADVMSHDGFTDEEIEKVFSKNVLRVFRECWK